jgi:hypothetical protein
MPSEQTYATHRRLVPAYHGVAFACVIAYLGWTVWHAVRAPGPATVMAVVLAVGVTLIFWYVRAFALTAQDRLIRLEERLRLERLLPADLHARIPDFGPGQLIALRFASDEELPSLARRVLDEGIRDREAIKKLIVHWRPDTFRV